MALLICWLITLTDMYYIEHQLHAVGTGHTLVNIDMVPVYSPMKWTVNERYVIVLCIKRKEWTKLGAVINNGRGRGAPT